ncbi:MBL fold metallo-hydrolase [Jeongeupia chitinilytica]|uniref:MBL fold metallo-hydrolase n=1 Tax=Jeongeupia chitinilytica TaxID=1041641 RepID=A0ABQ3H3J4_9NEIS|nr:MBL fold metallo-hydrolase [Jeongeupia chitinilytica]GHD68606.1 MBL fold metallo-hydrolase [Jeongeupia chitinilytica]
MNNAPGPNIEGFHDPVTGTVSYVVYDRVGGQAAIIDPVLDYAANAGRTGSRSVQRLADCLAANKLTLAWILETHTHADHLSAAAWLRDRLGGLVGIGQHIGAVQQLFARRFNLGDSFPADGRQFDRLFADGDTFRIGELEAEVMFVPGHTPADVAYRIGDAVFVGDTLFMPDVGTARCDFPGGDAGTLFDSIQRLFALPPQTRLFMCHDYAPAGRTPSWTSTVAEQRAANVHIGGGTARDAFVALRQQRDATLDVPALMLPAIQVNIRAGALPEPEANGTRYLKIPLDPQ